MRWEDFPLPDGSYSDDTRPWSQQDVVNYLPTPAEQSGTRSRMKYAPVPGLKPFAVIGDGPHRGARDVEGKAFIVSGRTLYQVTAKGVAIPRGTIPGTGLVSMTHNQVAAGNQVVIGTLDNSYVYDTRTEDLTATGAGLQSVDFLGQMIVGIEPQRRFGRYSGLADAMSWSTLDNISAESSPDRIVGGIVSNNEWLLFGERTIEPWVNQPTESSAFQRNTGAIIERGCINANTLQRLDNSVFFVDNNFIPCRLQGYTPVPIAPKPIIEALSKCDPRKLISFTWEDRGHVVYYVTAQDGQTFGFDVPSGAWHRRESFGMNRWRINTLFKWGGDYYGGDFSNGNLYKLEWGNVYEGESDIMPRGMRTGVLHSVGNRVQVHALKVLANSGLSPSVPAQFPEQPDGPSISGEAPDGEVGEAYEFQYTVTVGDGAILRTVIRSGTLLPGLSWDESTATISGTPTSGGYMELELRTSDTNGLYDDHSDSITFMGTVLWDADTATGGTGNLLDDGIGFIGTSQPESFISADTSVSSGDWYWETTTSWASPSGLLINEYCAAGLIRQSDSAYGLVLEQIEVTDDGGAVASGDELFSPQVLYEDWIPPGGEVNSATIRNHLKFSGGNAVWSIAIDDGEWIQIMSVSVSTFTPYGMSRGNDAESQTRAVYIYSRPDDFTYDVPEGALPLGLAPKS